MSGWVIWITLGVGVVFVIISSLVMAVKNAKKELEEKEKAKQEAIARGETIKEDPPAVKPDGVQNKINDIMSTIDDTPDTVEDTTPEE